MKHAAPRTPEEQLKRKNTAKKWKRAFLILLNAALGCYLLYFISDTLIEMYRLNSTQDESIYSINGYSQERSLELYDKAIDKVDDSYVTTPAFDYTYYGGYLHFKDSKAPTDESGNIIFSSFSSYTLRDLSSDVAFSSKLVFSDNGSLNQGIPLFSSEITKGDYLVYPYVYEVDGRQLPLKIDSEKGINVSFYTPSQNGVRKRITLKSRTSSPCLILSVRVVSALENNRKDIAVLYQNEDDRNNLASELNDGVNQVEYIKEEESISQNLISLYKSSSQVVLILESGDDIKVSHYIDTSHITDLNIINDEVLTEGYLKGYDQDIYIRELGGPSFLSGYGYNEENQILTPYVNDYDLGSIVIKVGSSRIQDISTILNQLCFYTISN